MGGVFSIGFEPMSSDSSLPALLDRLKQLRAALLKMHKAMLDAERSRYESVHGRVQSTGEMFRLVLEDPWFSWLRPISQFIVEIDEALAAKEPITLPQAEQLLVQARQLLQPAEKGSMMAQHYYDAIQRDPVITMLHADVSGILK
jgi:hypothetical protein